MAFRHTLRLWQKRASRIVTPPAVEPVTAQELRDFLRESAAGLPDDQAEAFITEARQLIEDFYNVAMIDQTWFVAADTFGADVRNPEMELPRWPLKTVEDFKVYDPDGTATDVDVSANFNVDVYSMPGRIRLKQSGTLTGPYRDQNAIEIEYTCGYGAASENIPAPIVRAVKQLAAMLYNNRGDCSTDELMNRSGAASIMRAYEVVRV